MALWFGAGRVTAVASAQRVLGAQVGNSNLNGGGGPGSPKFSGPGPNLCNRARTCPRVSYRYQMFMNATFEVNLLGRQWDSASACLPNVRTCGTTTGVVFVLNLDAPRRT